MDKIECLVLRSNKPVDLVCLQVLAIAVVVRIRDLVCLLCATQNNQPTCSEQNWSSELTKVPLQLGEGALLETNAQRNLVIRLGVACMCPPARDMVAILDGKRGPLLDWLAENRAGQKACCQDDSSALHGGDGFAS